LQITALYRNCGEDNHRGERRFTDYSVMSAMSLPQSRITRWEEYRKFGGCFPVCVNTYKADKNCG